MQKEIIDKLAALITAAFGLVAALAWNTAIQEWFKNQTVISNQGPWVYAVIITIVAVILTVWIGKVAEHAQKA